ncbi:EF-hand domain-containing protein 1 [Tritrichomonas musculus]|uniref:EF-hand domain-containing protein 1 n=1 Tax=Tritrichomonas musculus TaxID=1915356 RepID=A0ABR2HYN4_9EUKA
MTLPLLPGYTFPDPTQVKFHKSQALVFENGGQAIHENAPGIGGKLLPGQAPPKEAISSTSIYNQSMGGDFRTGETVPAWVAFGSQVLRFYGYFKEPIFSSQEENYRVRHVTILFFLEDDTIQILEPRERNSGIPQGTFLRRHRAKKDDDSYVNVGDFRIGGEFTLYGRTFYISDADKFTKEFLQKLNRPGGETSSVPDDPYLSTRNLREYEETHRNRGVPKPEMLKLRQFLANDGHVLRFYAYWDDRNRPFGDLRQFVINYFLADDTMEVNETLKQNDGRHHFPSFVRRSQIPKEVLALSENDPRFLSADHYYRPPDLKIGNTINILNRAMFIYDCDEFTRTWYRQNYGYTDQEMAPITTPQSQPTTKVSIQIPPNSLIGSEEDTIRNVMSLHPKPPPKDEQKLISKMHDVLRFTAKMITKNAVDASRNFIITFYLSDDTIQIYEPPQRNSGIVAGKFLQRTKMKNPETGEYFRPSDLEVGRIVTINGLRFQLLQATEYAMSYMEADPDNFPQADLVTIIEKLRYAIKQTGQTPKELFTQYSDHGKMDVQHLMQLFRGVGFEITLHEALTVMRRYQLDDDSHTFTLREFLQFAQ